MTDGNLSDSFLLDGEHIKFTDATDEQIDAKAAEMRELLGGKFGDRAAAEIRRRSGR